jgi:hypothetical protein
MAACLRSLNGSEEGPGSMCLAALAAMPATFPFHASWHTNGTRRMRTGRPSEVGRWAAVARIRVQKWRGWMGIEPTQDASAAPRRRF